MKKMAVHSGTFHADDVFAVALMYGIYDDLEVVRTRDEAELSTCDIIADVGGGQYDHHYVNKKLRADGIPYCAFGLLWQDFGIDYIKNNFEPLPQEQYEEIKDRIAIDFITVIDANDNGLDIVRSDYKIMTVSGIIDVFMPFDATQAAATKGFFEAVELAKKILYHVVAKEVRYFGDFNYVKEQLAIQNPKESHILVLEKRVSFKKPLIKLDIDMDVLFVVYKDLSDKWMVQNIQLTEDSFDARKNLPDSWAGLNEEALDKVTGIDGCVFCHPAKFLCGNKTKEGALAMARLAVEA
ncbi:MYG1 family protein [Candidatus Epulonipiscium viviparus]|uniref:MYG1 family protein n=1 Tax=Candidatus Epulonipiscium viviparus TaxID=420336 RepID=UPI0027380682|nr:MYG1 family protein [Candidatus Epulopiscium viviparus]